MPKSNIFSYSKIDTYSQCHYKYKLKYEDGHYIFCNSIATELGTLTHSTEESIAKCLQAKQPINYIELKNNYITKIYELQHKYPKEFLEVDKSGRTYKDKCYYYLENTIYKLEQFMLEHPTYEIVGIEQAFNFSFGNYKFKGFIDRVFKDTAQNKLLIQDIKTYAIKVDNKNLEAPLQFVIYTLAAEQLYNIDRANIQCQYYLPFVDNGLQQLAGEKNFIAAGITELTKLFTSIEQQDWKPTPTPLCGWCEFSCTNPNAPKDSHLLCPYHSNWTKESKKITVANRWEGSDNDAIIVELYKREMSV